MRASSARRPRHEEEEESVFVSMTDMTVSFLFIVMLLLAFFANQYDPDKSVPLPEHQRVLSQRDALQVQRDALIVELSDARRDLAETRRQLERAEAELEQRRIMVVAQQRRIEELEALVAKLRHEVDILDAKIRELEQELTQLRKPDPLEVYIRQSEEARQKILEQLRDAIVAEFPELENVLSVENDALRFQGDGLFGSGQATLRPDRRGFIESVAQRLQQILPCYTLGQNSDRRDDCNAGFALIEAVQIEGHTDADGNDIMNLGLSTARANETFRIMLEHEAGLTTHLNFRNQPVLSVAGYGEMRPIAPNDGPETKAANRRIDLRIIMYVPVNSDQIETVRTALTSGPVGRP